MIGGAAPGAAGRSPAGRGGGRRLRALALASALLLAGAGPRRDHVAYLAVRGDAVVAAHDAERLVTPGSLAKLIVATALLHHLGPEHRLVTELRTTARRDGETLHGDLVLVAAADPTWSVRFFPFDPRAPLAALAAALVSAGVRRVEGDLVVDLGRFPGRPAPPSRGIGEAAYGWAAPAAAAAVDEATVVVEVGPGSWIGGPARASTASGLGLDNRATTAGPERRDKGTLDVLPRWGTDVLLLRGEVPQGEPVYRIEAADPQPELRAGLALRDALALAGVAVSGEVRLSAVPVAASGTVLARLASPPLAEILEPVLVDSRNWIAETLLRALAVEARGDGRDETGLAVLSTFLVETVGVAKDAVVLEDASGLSPADLVAPEAVVALLRWAWRQPWRDAFLAALPRSDQGTLATWPPLPPLAAKTGTQTHAVALAGYLDPATALATAAEPLAFCVVVERRPDRAAARAEVAALVRGWAASR